MQSELPALHALARRMVLSAAAASHDAAAVACAAHQVFDQLAAVLTPIIGRTGIDALAARALHLTAGQHAWLTAAPSEADEPGGNRVARFASLLAQQAPDAALDAGAVFLSTFARLLTTLVGVGLTDRLIRQAWPAAFTDPDTKETAR